MTKHKLPHEVLSDRFLQKAGASHANVVRVLRTTTYKIGKAHVLVRSIVKPNASNRYFFGINRATIEEVLNLPNPFVAFICGDAERSVIVPARVLFDRLGEISSKQGGEDYRITLDSDLNIALKGRGNRLNCQNYINRLDFFGAPPPGADGAAASAEESGHAILQGRLIEIGNIRGFHTYCPDKGRMFNNRKLSELLGLQKCPDLQYSDYNMLRKIDVLWFRKRDQNYVPQYAFEVELTTGVWSGVGRMSTLIDYADARLYVIAENQKKYNQVVGTLPDERRDRYRYLQADALGDLYSAEKNLVQLRGKMGL